MFFHGGLQLIHISISQFLTNCPLLLYEQYCYALEVFDLFLRPQYNICIFQIFSFKIPFLYVTFLFLLVVFSVIY